MTFPAKQQSSRPAASIRKAADPRRARTRFCRTGLVVVAVLGGGVLAAACGRGSSGPGVASLGKTTTTMTGSSGPQSGSTSPENSALIFVDCMRTHGEPNMPDPTIEGTSTHLVIASGSRVDANSPQFAAANTACKHLLPNNGVPQQKAITPADQDDYLKAVACMRSHGVPDFPDPTFQTNNVTFYLRSAIDTNSSQYKSALATCEKLIPAGLPYSSAS
jgi:hypothetical protein